MKKIVISAISLLLIGAMIFAFASCADKGKNNKSTTAAASGASTTAAPVVEDLAYVTQNKKIVIGITDFEPMDFQDANKNWVGFDAELAQKVCEKLGVKAEFQLIDWKNKETELKGKTIDCIWNGFTINDERKANLTFSQEYMANEQVIVIRKADASKYTDLASIAKAAIVAEDGSAGADAIEATAALKNANFVPVDGQIKALQEVLAKTADVAVIDSIMANYLINKAGSDFASLAVLKIKIAEPEYYGIGFRKGSDLAAKVDQIIDGFQADGTIAALAAKYNLTDAVKDIK